MGDFGVVSVVDWELLVEGVLGRGNVASVEPPHGRLGRGGRLFRHRGKGWSPETVSCGEKKGSQVGRGESHGKENVSGRT